MDGPLTSEIESAAEANPEAEVSAQATAADANSSQEGATDEEPVSGMELLVYNAATTGNHVHLSGYGASLSEKLTATKNTVLHIYIACNNSDNIETVNSILSSCPALLSKANMRGETALHIAARYGHDAIVQCLIDAAKKDLEEGYRLFIRTTNEDMDTALHEAVPFNHPDVVKILIREESEDHPFSYSANAAGETPLYMAVERGHINLVTEILDTCKDVNFQGPNRRSALHAAVSYNDIEMTKKLLSYKTPERPLTNAVDEKGWTPLHLAAWFGHSSIVKLLLYSDKSAAYVRDGVDKRTALHIAAFKGYLCVFKELTEQCPDCCELLDSRQRSVLHYAIENNQLHIQDFIRQNRWLSNVLLNGKDEDLTTPLQQLLAVSVREVRKPSGECMLIMKSSSKFIRDARVDKMAFNKRNQNAFDIIGTEIASAWEKDLGKKLKKNGGRPSHRIVIKQDTGEQETDKIKVAAGKDSTRDTRDERIRELKQVHLIAATLIATVTFAAGMNLPGGYESQKGPDQGFAVLRRDNGFGLFLCFNTASMILSASSVGLHFILVNRWGPAMLRRLLYLTSCAMMFMLAAFIAGLWTVIRDGAPIIIFLFMAVCLVIVTLFSTKQKIQRFLHFYIPGNCPDFVIDFFLAMFKENQLRNLRQDNT